jgi:hypothetical protein
MANNKKIEIFVSCSLIGRREPQRKKNDKILAQHDVLFCQKPSGKT